MKIKRTGVTDHLQMSEAVTIDSDGPNKFRLTEDGYLVASPRVARTGIQIYAGSELGQPTLDQVRVYRPEEEVFHKDALQSYAFRPVTVDHPPEPVNAGNWSKYSVGGVGGEIARDGEFVRVPMVLMDSESIKAVQSGKRQLSLGYTTDVKWGSGTTPSGEQYDAIQTNIRANHLAVVGAARGGPLLKIGDKDSSKTGAKGKMKTITVDGISVQIEDDTTASVIERSIAAATKTIDALKASVADLTTQVAKATDGAVEAAKVAVATITTKDAEIITLKKQVEDAKVTPALLDALVTDRNVTIFKARAILGDKLVVDGKTVDEVRKQVVDAKLGDAAKGWGDKEITASFNSFTADVKLDGMNKGEGANGVNDAIQHFMQPALNASDARSKAYGDYDKTLTESWRTPAN